MSSRDQKNSLPHDKRLPPTSTKTPKQVTREMAMVVQSQRGRKAMVHACQGHQATLPCRVKARMNFPPKSIAHANENAGFKNGKFGWCKNDPRHFFTFAVGGAVAESCREKSPWAASLIACASSDHSDRQGCSDSAYRAWAASMDFQGMNRQGSQTHSPQLRDPRR